MTIIGNVGNGWRQVFLEMSMTWANVEKKQLGNNQLYNKQFYKEIVRIMRDTV